MAIFHHQDCDGDAIELLAEDDPQEDLVLFYSNRNGQRAGGVRIDRDAALRLYSALGEWLYPVHTPEGPNRSLIEQLIAKAVKDQVAAVLPLHLAPGGALRISGPCKGHVDAGQDHDPDPGLCRGGYGCDALGVHAAYGSACGRPDPEPRDVGHVEEPRPCDASMKPGERLSDVHKECGFLWALHKVIPPADAPQGRCEGCRSGNHPHVFRPCEKPGCGCRETVPESEHGRLMTELPRRTRSRAATRCLDCLHGWGEHTGGICWGTGGHDNLGNGCTCTRERPGAALLRKQMQEEAAPPPCTECGHPYLSHGDECAAMLRDDHAIKCGCTRYRSTR